MSKLGKVGPYTLLERLGRGGMGEVYLASARRGERVALKVLHDLNEDESSRIRLEREVRALRRVESPYVAKVLDADLSCARPYLVMEHIEGATLLDLVRKQGSLGLSQLVDLAHGIATALAIIHAAGIVHRDLKPGNILMGNDGPVLIDFGIAQVIDATRLTMTGTFLGTPGYTAPEIFADEQVESPADVHAWGATVAFAATGRPTFGRGTPEAQMYAVLNGHADLKGVPVALLPLVRAALNREPGKRPTAALLADRLARLAKATSAAEAEVGGRAGPGAEEEVRGRAGEDAKSTPPRGRAGEDLVTPRPRSDGKAPSPRPRTTTDGKAQPRTRAATDPKAPSPRGRGVDEGTARSRGDEGKGATPRNRGDDVKARGRGDDGKASPSRVRGDDGKLSSPRMRGDDGKAPSSRVRGDDGKAPSSRVRGDDGKVPPSRVRGDEGKTTARSRVGGDGRGAAVRSRVREGAQTAVRARTRSQTAAREARLRSEATTLPAGNTALVLLAVLAVPCVVASVMWPIASIGITAVFVVLTRALWMGHWMVRKRASRRVRVTLRVLMFPFALVGAVTTAVVWPGAPVAVAAGGALWVTGGGVIDASWWHQPAPVTVAGVVFGMLCGGITGREIERIGSRMPELRREGLRALAVLGGFVALCAAAVRAIALLL